MRKFGFRRAASKASCPLVLRESEAPQAGVDLEEHLDGAAHPRERVEARHVVHRGNDVEIGHVGGLLGQRGREQQNRETDSGLPQFHDVGRIADRNGVGAMRLEGARHRQQAAAERVGLAHGVELDVVADELTGQLEVVGDHAQVDLHPARARKPTHDRVLASGSIPIDWWK